MATDMIVGHLYLIESDAGDNQNWLHTVDNIALATNYAGKDGDEYCHLEMPKRWAKKGSTGIIITDSGGGKSFDLRSSRRAYQMLSEGIETSISNGEKVESFLMRDSHTVASTATFKRYYLIVKYGTTSYTQFMDSTSTMRDYCTGGVTDFEIIWDESKPQNVLVRMTFRSIW